MYLGDAAGPDHRVAGKDVSVTQTPRRIGEDRLRLCMAGVPQKALCAEQAVMDLLKQ